MIIKIIRMIIRNKYSIPFPTRQIDFSPIQLASSCVSTTSAGKCSDAFPTPQIPPKPRLSRSFPLII